MAAAAPFDGGVLPLWRGCLYTGMESERDHTRELVGLSDSERLTVVLAIGVLALAWSVIAGAWLAAAIAGERLGVSGQPAIEAAFRLPSRLSDPARAWPEPAAARLPGPLVYWPSTLAAASPWVVAAWWWTTRRKRRTIGLDSRERLGVNAEAHMASRAEIAPLVVDGPTPGRFLLGTVHDLQVATEKPISRPASVQTRPLAPLYRPARGSVLIVGPSQCGKSTCAITGMLEWDGPIAASSVKTDLIDETFGWRADQGECRVFDPTSITGLPTASWSPLRGAHSIEGAQSSARALVDCAPRSGADGDFWYQLAEVMLAGYLWVAATQRLTMRDVVRWVFTQDAPGENGPGEVQPLLLLSMASPDPFVSGQAATASEMLEGGWCLEDRMRSSIFGTAQAAVWPWMNPTVAGSAEGSCGVTLDWLLSGNNTLYASTPLRAAKRLAPAIGGLIGDLLDQVAQRVAATGRPLDPPLLLVLDEVGNTPLRELPELVSTLSGLGVQIVTIWQSITQVKAAYKDHAGTIIANHRSKVFFSGISDPDTFELAVRLVGDEQVVNRMASRELGLGERSSHKSLQESTITTSAVPGHVLRQQPSGTALLIHGTIPPAHLRTRSHLEDPVLFERAHRPLPIARGFAPTPVSAAPSTTT